MDCEEPGSFPGLEITRPGGAPPPPSGALILDPSLCWRGCRSRRRLQARAAPTTSVQDAFPRPSLYFAQFPRRQ